MSFTQRAKTPNNSNEKFLTESTNHYNTFNKARFSSFRDKIKKKAYNSDINYYRPNSYKGSTFLKSTAPFKYSNNRNERNGLLVCYNGGPRKKFHPIITRDNLSQFLRNRSTSYRFKRPCGCYSNYYSEKYKPEYYYPNYERNEQYNTFYKQNNLPYISDNDNLRYTNGFMSPQIGNRKNGNITYKLKDNFEDEKLRINTESNNYEKNQNMENQNQEQNEKKEENNEVKYEEKKEEINGEKYEYESYKEKMRKKFSYFNIRPRRSFHKVQIFNNCKPFLVDDFKEYGYYE